MIDTKTANELIDRLDKGMTLAHLMETAATSFGTWISAIRAEWWRQVLSDEEMTQLYAIEAAIGQARTASAKAATGFDIWTREIKQRVAKEQKDPDVVQFIWLREQLTTCNPTREADIANWRAEMLHLYRTLKDRYDSGELIRLLIFQEGYESLIEPVH